MTIREVLDSYYNDTLEEGRFKKALAIAILAVSMGAKAFAGDLRDLTAAKQMLNYNQSYSTFNSQAPDSIIDGKSKVEIYTSYNYESQRPKITIFLRCFKKDLGFNGKDDYKIDHYAEFDKWMKNTTSEFHTKLVSLLNNLNKFDYEGIANVEKPQDTKIDVEIKIYADFDVRGMNFKHESLEYCRDAVKTECEKQGLSVGSIKVYYAEEIRSKTHNTTTGYYSSEYYDKERMQKVYDDYQKAKEEEERLKAKQKNGWEKTLDGLDKFAKVLKVVTNQ